MRKVLIAIVLLALASPAMAGYYIAGDFNGWNPAGTAMTDMGDGTWKADLSQIGAGRHEFKITQGDWSWNFPGPNSWLYADADGSASVTFDPNTRADGWSPDPNRIAVNTDAALAWNVVGGFNGWNNNDPAFALVPLGGGLLGLNTVLPAGTYEFKFVVAGSWDSISWDSRSVNTSNWSFTSDGTTATSFLLDTTKGTAKVGVVPEPSSLLALAAGVPFLAIFRKRR